MKHPLVGLVLACAALLGGGGASAATASVKLRPQAEAADRDVRLSEIAKVASEDADVARALNELVVARIAMVGRPTRVLRSELARYVHAHRPWGTTTVEWQGAEAVSIQIRAVRVEPQQIIDRAAGDLKAALERGGASIDVRPVSHVDVLRLPPGEVSITTRLPAGDGEVLQPSRRMRVEIEVAQRGEALRRLPLWFEVRALAPGWVARGDLQPGHPLGSADLQQGTVDRAQLAGDTVVDVQEAVGMRLRRPLRGGEAIRRSLLEPMPAVTRGSAVSVQVKAGPVTVGANGVALADGSTGQLVPVRVSGAQVLRGRVVAPGVLEVESIQ